MFEAYFKELKDLDIYQQEAGFILYRIDGKYVYIHDMFIKPEFRQQNHAKTMADYLTNNAKELLGCTHLRADIQPSNKTATMAMKVLLAYGMEIVEANDDEIVLIKEI